MGPAPWPSCASKRPVRVQSFRCPPIQPRVSRVAASGGELVAPWPSCAPLRPVRARGVPCPARREGRRPVCPPRPTRPAASRRRRAPPVVAAPMPASGQAPPPTAGFACGRAAATPDVGRWVRAPRGRPSRSIRLSRACGLASNAVRCEHSPHLLAFTVLVPASPDLAATCSPQYSARARLSRASPRPRARSPPRGDP